MGPFKSVLDNDQQPQQTRSPTTNSTEIPQQTCLPSGVPSRNDPNARGKYQLIAGIDLVVIFRTLSYSMVNSLVNNQREFTEL
jgi:hypothetical protein